MLVVDYDEYPENHECIYRCFESRESVPFEGIRFKRKVNVTLDDEQAD